MRKVKIVVIWPADAYGPLLSDENLKKISAISPEISLKDASLLLTEEQEANFSHKDDLDALLAEAEVLFARVVPKDIVKRASKLKWIQIGYAGMEKILIDKDLGNSPIKITNAAGAQAAAISEYALTLILAFDKYLPHFARLKQNKKWEKTTMKLLGCQTVGILGLGHIGREIAKRAKAFGAKVLAYDLPRARVPRYVDKLLSGEQIVELLSKSDFVISALPSTPQTRGLIGEKQLRLMKPSAYLINISRGAIVDEKALVSALEENWISGAGLDVFTTEPLPKESKLWELPNVIISPHCCGIIDDIDTVVVELFCENLKRYLGGKRLLNKVDKNRGF